MYTFLHYFCLLNKQTWTITSLSPLKQRPDEASQAHRREHVCPYYHCDRPVEEEEMRDHDHDLFPQAVDVNLRVQDELGLVALNAVARRD